MLADGSISHFHVDNKNEKFKTVSLFKNIKQIAAFEDGFLILSHSGEIWMFLEEARGEGQLENLPKVLKINTIKQESEIILNTPGGISKVKYTKQGTEVLLYTTDGIYTICPPSKDYKIIPLPPSLKNEDLKKVFSNTKDEPTRIMQKETRCLIC